MGQQRIVRRSGRINVKTGCRTCKTRKVKCDEGRPACQRCLATGRVCDGYGIWGGGGNSYSSRQSISPFTPSSSECASPPSRSLVTFSGGLEEGDYVHFGWFQLRAVPKLPGILISDFWSTLLLQASQSEPAVMHAILALSSVHRKGFQSCEFDDRGERITVVEEREEFALQHYVKAINHLQPHFAGKDKASLRVALITCVLFISLELLRGHFETAMTHFLSGLKVLVDMQCPAGTDPKDTVIRSRIGLNTIDDWIIEAFSRLQLQVQMFRQGSKAPYFILPPEKSEAARYTFVSIPDAWKQMEPLLNRIFCLTQQSHQQAACEGSHPRQQPVLFGELQRFRLDLVQWWDSYQEFFQALEPPTSVYNTIERRLFDAMVRSYHTMVTIMAGACLSPRDESVYDVYTDQFLVLLKHVTTIFGVRRRTQPTPVLPGQFDMSRSILDVASIPQVYFVAMKCRVHRIRLQAIRQLESTSHREGIWDANIAACVARKVMELEERDFYGDEDTADDFLPASGPDARDLLLPMIPESYRLREVEVVLSGAPMDRILLYCKQRQDDVDRRVLVAGFSVLLQRWVDVQEGGCV